MSADGKIKVATEAMRSDAAVWSTAAGDLEGPINSIGDMKLTGGEMSFFATEKGLDFTYEEARSALEDMLSKASKYFQKISDNLNSAAQQYEQDDNNAARELDQSGQGLN